MKVVLPWQKHPEELQNRLGLFVVVHQSKLQAEYHHPAMAVETARARINLAATLSEARAIGEAHPKPPFGRVVPYGAFCFFWMSWY